MSRLSGHEHRRGDCRCQKVRGTAWIDRSHCGGEEPYLLVVPVSGADPSAMHNITMGLGLAPGVMPYPGQAQLSLARTGVGYLVAGARGVGPIMLSPEWIRLARTVGHVVVLVGSVPVPDRLDPRTYLERHEVAARTLPIADARVGVR